MHRYERGVADGGKRAGYPGCKVYLKRSLAAPAPGVKIKTTFVGIFNSGKVIISGAPSLEEARNAYDFIKSTLHRSYERIRGTPDEPSMKKLRST